jgi:hypothetical protein
LTTAFERIVKHFPGLRPSLEKRVGLRPAASPAVRRYERGPAMCAPSGNAVKYFGPVNPALTGNWRT